MKTDIFVSVAAVALLSCLLPSLAFAEDCIDYGEFPEGAPLVCGESGFGSARDVVLRDSIAFVVDDVGLKVIDTSVLEEPTIIASINTPGQATGLAISGDWAYIADNEQGLQVVSIEDFNNLEIVATVDPVWTWAYDVFVSGAYAYVAGSTPVSSGLLVVDVSTPSLPELVTIVPTNGAAWSISGSGDTLFLTQYWSSSNEHFLSIDISTPTSPIVMDSISLPAPGNCVAINDSLAAVSWGERDFSPGGMSLVDISDPSNLAVIGELPDLSYPVLGLIFQENEVLVGAGFDVLVVDIAVPDAMSIVEIVASTNGYKWAIEIVETAAYICGTQSLDVVDVGEPGMSEIVASILKGPGVRAVVSQGRYVYASSIGLNWPSTLRVYHLADPPVLNLVAEVEMYVGAMCMYESYIIVASGSSLLVVDVVNPSIPTVVGQADGIIGSTRDMVCVEGEAVLVTHSHFMVVDVSNPLLPIIRGGIELPGYPYASGVDVSGGHAFVVTYESSDPRIFTIDISDPEDPVIVAESELTVRSWDIAISGQHAYLAGEHGTITVLDISNPLLPEQVGMESFNNSLSAQSIQISEDHAYMANSDLGLVVIDIEDPTSPTKIGSADTPHSALDVAIGENFICLADNSSGLQIASLHCGEATDVIPTGAGVTSLTGNYPNPFNPNTKIRFTIGEPQHVYIAVYDINGKLVKEIADEKYQTGQHQVSWNGVNSRGGQVSSGIYFISMNARGFRQSRQVVLVK
jgi:hypothetical protein